MSLQYVYSAAATNSKLDYLLRLFFPENMVMLW